MYDAGTMHQKSITFRCPERLLQRLANLQQLTESNRTELITAALNAFLDYTGQEHICRMNLHELVRDIDSSGDGQPFCEQT